MFKLRIHQMMLSAFLFMSTMASAEILETISFVSHDPVQVILKENRSSDGILIGLHIYQLTVERKVGTAFFIHKSFYRFNTKEIIEDVEYYRIRGFLSKDTAEIVEEFHTQRWSIDKKVAKAFDNAIALLAEGNMSREQKIKLYKKFEFSPFSKRSGDRERKGVSLYTWLLGNQRIDDVIFELRNSNEFGNIFKARFISK